MRAMLWLMAPEKVRAPVDWLVTSSVSARVIGAETVGAPEPAASTLADPVERLLDIIVPWLRTRLN